MTTLDTPPQTPPAQQPKNGTTTILLIVLGVVVGLGALCALVGLLSVTLLGAMVGRAAALSAERNPAAIEAIAADIAEFTVPPGYVADYGMQLLGFSLVAYDPGDGQSHLMVMQVPDRFGLDRAALEQQMQRMSRYSGQYAKDDLKIVDQRQVQIRGQEVTLLTGDGVNHEGQAFREVSTVFPGKEGPALLVFETPVNQWDQAAVDAFLASIQ